MFHEIYSIVLCRRGFRASFFPVARATTSEKDTIMKTLFKAALIALTLSSPLVAEEDSRPDVTRVANQATSEELQEVRGIGEKKAEAIIAGRPYSHVKELLEVKGIGIKTLQNFCDLVDRMAD